MQNRFLVFLLIGFIAYLVIQKLNSGKMLNYERWQILRDSRGRITEFVAHREVTG